MKESGAPPAEGDGRQDHRAITIGGAAKHDRHPNYNASDAQWSGRIPDHWQSIESRRVLLRVRREPMNGEGVVTAFRDGEVTLRTNRRTEGFTEALQEIGYQGIRRGDLVVHAMDGFAGAIGVSDSNGNASPVVHAYRSNCMDLRYVAYTLRSVARAGYITALAKGIRERSTAFDSATLASLPLLVPPLPEQRQIANYLDTQTAKIDVLVAKQEQLIATLRERRVALISQAVTKGIDPDAPMKESGIEWIGKVPFGWGVTRLKSILRTSITDGPHTTPMFLNEGVPFLSVDGIQDGELRFDRCRYITEQEHEVFRTKTLPQRDDILMGKAASTGKIARVKVDFEFSIWSPLALIRLNTAMSSPTFVEYTLKSSTLQAQIDVLCTSNTQKNISMDDIPELMLPLPPLPEQRQIADYLDEQTAKIDLLIEKAQRFNELAKERRSALITAAVTGQIDVRDAEDVA